MEEEKAHTEEATPEVKDRKPAKRPRHSSPRESKAAQRMLNGLLDQISGHRNGNVFAQPVKKACPPHIVMLTGGADELIQQ